MNALCQYATLKMMLQNKTKVTVKEALNAIATVESAIQNRARNITMLLHVKG